MCNLAVSGHWITSLLLLPTTPLQQTLNVHGWISLTCRIPLLVAKETHHPHIARLQEIAHCLKLVYSPQLLATDPMMLLFLPRSQTLPSLKGLFNFASSGFPFIPHRFLSGIRNEQEKGTNVSTCAETALVVPFVNEPNPTSIRVPDAKAQPSLIYSDSEDEESSEDEEMPKQTWRAERFHMEEFLREMRVC